MKTIIILALALLCGLALADGQQGQTIDSLNVRYIWGMLGSFPGLALESDSTVWTIIGHTDTLVEIIASDAANIDTNFYSLDSTFTRVLGLVDDSMLIVTEDGGWIRTINVKSSPPTLIGNYYSDHIADPPQNIVYMFDSLLIAHDLYDPGSKLAFIDISDPANIDTFVTGIDMTTCGYYAPWYYAKKDSTLYGVFLGSFGPGPWWPEWSTYIYIINVADYSNPVLDTVYEFERPYGSAFSPSGSSPCVIIDSFLFVAISNEEVQYHIEVYDISNPTVPAYYDSFPHSGGGPYGALDVDYQEPYLYVGSRIYDITDYPETDSLIGYGPYGAYYLIPNGKYIYEIEAWGFYIFEFFEWDSTQAILDNPPPRKTYEDIFLLPNPFNSAVTISVDCHSCENGNPEIEIYDINGRLVDNIPIARGNSAPANREYIWQPDKSVGSGIYLVRAKIGDNNITKRVVYLK